MGVVGGFCGAQSRITTYTKTSKRSLPRPCAHDLLVGENWIAAGVSSAGLCVLLVFGWPWEPAACLDSALCLKVKCPFVVFTFTGSCWKLFPTPQFGRCFRFDAQPT